MEMNFVLLNAKSNNTNSTPVNATLTGTTTFNGIVNGLTSAMVNLGNVANTAPSGLPISLLTQSALNLKRPLTCRILQLVFQFVIVPLVLPWLTGICQTTK